MEKEQVSEIAEKAYDLGFEYEKVYRGCSQAGLAAIQDILNIKNDDVFKAATGFAGGGGLSGGQCLRRICGRCPGHWSAPGTGTLQFQRP